MDIALKDLILLSTNPNCRIWSSEYRAWWRDRGMGYTENIEDAGIWRFVDAFDISSHCDQSKGIIYEILPGKS